MKVARLTRSTGTSNADRDARICDLLALHFHPELGSAYWLKRQERLGWKVCDRMRSEKDLWLVGQTPLDDLRRCPIREFIPRAFHGQLHRFVTGETAGTSGEPRATAYRSDEFRAAFITPFLRVARATAFPRNLHWLWVGPSGPHIIGKAVRELARRTGCLDPFSVDFDPRWAKRLPEGSLARQRYVEHVTSQAMDVLAREEIGVLCTTPPVLQALAERMTDRQRESILGVHYGGLSVTPETMNRFREVFPRAIHLSGYGNTLFGVVMEVTDTQRLALDYFPLSNRIRFSVVQWRDSESDSWPPEPAGRGVRGQLVFDRLDESCLLVGVRERDEAELIAPSEEAIKLGGCADGLRDPRPLASLAGHIQLGLY